MHEAMSMFPEYACNLCEGTQVYKGGRCPACTEPESFARASDPHTSHERELPDPGATTKRIHQFGIGWDGGFTADDLADTLGGQRSVWSRCLTTAWRAGAVARKVRGTGELVVGRAPEGTKFETVRKGRSSVILHWSVTS